MSISVLGATGRLLLPVTAAVLLAGVSLEAAAAGGRGVIKLVTSNETGRAVFQYVDTSGAVTQTQEFSIERGTKCIVDEDSWVNWSLTGGTSSGLASLVDVKAHRFNGEPVGTNSGIGLLNGSIGVYDSTKGTSCSRITDSLLETLTLTSKLGGFDKLEIDLEAKGSAVFELVIDKDTSKKYRLYTGNSVKSSLGANEQNCFAGSDSGPDSGPNDNCPWVIEDVGISFEIYAIDNDSNTGTAGEGSLEGGGDYVSAGMTGDYTTKIFLTSLIDIGSLGCLSSNNTTRQVFADPDSQGAASCQVTRINPNNFLPGSCTEDKAIDYRLETFEFESLCRLDKTGTFFEQVAGSIEVTFEPELRTEWDGVAKTALTFTDENGNDSPPFFAELCGGTRVPDKYGNLTIKEVLLGTLPGYVNAAGDFVYTSGDAPPDFTKTTLQTDNDQVPGNEYYDWACVLDHRVEYLGKNSQGDDLQQVTQIILFWGDLGLSRPGIGSN